MPANGLLRGLLNPFHAMRVALSAMDNWYGRPVRKSHWPG
ncbi:MAG: hypothetical protein OJF60_003217 [Burkholderiaceae bacterium]|nr:MAG: hypothetical protein OJF60_003217 [Burkholderiaceae bacterium]